MDNYRKNSMQGQSESQSQELNSSAQTSQQVSQEYTSGQSWQNPGATQQQQNQPNNAPADGMQRTNGNGDLQFMRENPIPFFLLEYGALLISNYCGIILGIVLTIICFISGNRYREINATHGIVMMVLSALMFVVQF